jgi:hypothetical protein
MSPGRPNVVDVITASRVGAAIGLFLYAALGVGPVARAQQEAPTEYQVKAAYLYNFGKFVSWPAQHSAAQQESFEICILGEDPFGTALEAAVKGGTISGRNAMTKRIATTSEVDDCRILFISTSEDQRLKDILASLENFQVLTVSDIPQFADRGGMIQFVQQNSRIRFEVNLRNAEHSGLILSSELLKVAVRVNGSPHAGN